MVIIENRVVFGGPELELPKTLSYGKYVIDNLKSQSVNRNKIAMVAPADVENVVVEHGSVRECGVVGARDAAAGELPTAFVVTTPGAELTHAELIHYTNNRLPPHCQLHRVIFVEEIPRSESGKVLRRVLRNQLRNYND